MYGGQSGAPDEKRYYEAFRRRYHELNETQRKWIAKVERTKQLRTPSGLIFYWPKAKYTNSGYFNETTAVSNYPIQSMATAEIVPIAVVYLWHRLQAEGLESFLVSTIHDSVLAEVKESEQEVYNQFATEAFEKDTIRYMQAVYGIEWDVPLATEGSFKTHWNTSSEWEHSYL